MNWLEFVSALISDVVWPAVVVIGLLLFRKTLRKAVETLLAKSTGKLSGLGMVAEWNALVEQVESGVTPSEKENAPLLVSSSGPDVVRPESGTRRIVVDKSMIGIMEVLLAIDRKLLEALRSREIDLPAAGELEQLSAISASHGVISLKAQQALYHIIHMVPKLLEVPDDVRSEHTQELFDLATRVKLMIDREIANPPDQ